jgi:hypothetical protein
MFASRMVRSQVKNSKRESSFLARESHTMNSHLLSNFSLTLSSEPLTSTVSLIPHQRKTSRRRPFLRVAFQSIFCTHTVQNLLFLLQKNNAYHSLSGWMRSFNFKRTTKTSTIFHILSQVMIFCPKATRFLFILHSGQ